ncbi:MAG: hypothetical protein K0R09_1020, partial [Clostridiales bacterium]|nr:hypothetical protein [Clostridiales bacterium]
IITLLPKLGVSKQLVFVYRGAGARGNSERSEESVGEILH